MYHNFFIHIKFMAILLLMDIWLIYHLRLLLPKFSFDRTYKNACIVSWDIFRSETAGRWGMSISNFITKWKLFSKVIVPISTPINNVGATSLLYISVHTFYFQIVNFVTLVCILYQCCSGFYFQIIDELEYGRIFLPVIWISFLWRAHWSLPHIFKLGFLSVLF